MNKTVKILGSITITLIMLLVPIIFVMSFVYNWFGLIKTVLTIMLLLELTYISEFVYDYISDTDKE